MMPEPQAFFKGLLRNLRDGGLKSAIGFLRACQMPNQAILDANLNKPVGETEIHLLTGSERLHMAIWMALSWVHATGKNWKFILHDDGNLSPESCKSVRKLLPHSRIVYEDEKREILRQKLEKFPNCMSCRNLHPLCRKLFDIPLLAGSDKLFMIDTDILFFKPPRRLIRWMDVANDGLIFMNDISDNTLPEVLRVATDCGLEVVKSINTGIVGVPKDLVNLDDLEKILCRTNILEAPRWYIEQSLFALIASLRGGVEILESNPAAGECYQLDLDAKIHPNAVMRHYVGKVRHLFYSEGFLNSIQK
jgi:hypothetical protein